MTTRTVHFPADDDRTENAYRDRLFVRRTATVDHFDPTSRCNFTFCRDARGDTFPETLTDDPTGTEVALTRTDTENDAADADGATTAPAPASPAATMTNATTHRTHRNHAPIDLPHSFDSAPSRR